MFQLPVRLSSIAEIRDFVCIATVHPFPISVCTEWQNVSAKSFMGMFSLDLSLPLFVQADCSPEEFSQLQTDLSRFLVE